MMSKKAPNPVDVHVGSRLRLRRIMLGISQEKLGAELGLTFQQIQKYEKGMNRIGASRLYAISRALDTSIQYFFDDLPADGRPPAAQQALAARSAGRVRVEHVAVPPDELEAPAEEDRVAVVEAVHRRQLLLPAEALVGEARVVSDHELGLVREVICARGWVPSTHIQSFESEQMTTHLS